MSGTGVGTRCHAADSCSFDPRCPFTSGCRKAEGLPVLSDRELARIRDRFERKRRRPVRLPLPFWTRNRLHFEHRVNAAGIWLANNGHRDAAEWLWRACGMWD